MATRAEIVTIAQGWAGTPYRHQASAKGAGADCLGLLRGVWRDIYESEPETPPPYRPDWYEGRGEDLLLSKAHEYLVKADNMQAGDVIVFRMRPKAAAKHVAIYIGDDRMIHAVSGRSVSENNLTDWYRRRIVGVFSFPGVE